MDKLYSDVNFPGAFSGASNLRRETKGIISKKEFDKFLINNRTYTLYRSQRLKYPRLKTIPRGFMTDVQIDLADFQLLKKYSNEQNTFLLVATDVLSRRIFVAPLKSKRPIDVQKGFDSILERMPFKPLFVYSDRGNEFHSKSMQDYFENKGIKKFVSQNVDVKASVCERSIRTIKERLYRWFTEKNSLSWINVIQKIVDGINNSVCRVTNLRPMEINEKNQQVVWDKLYKNEEQKTYKSKLKVGDFVRIPNKRGTFEKSHLANWSDYIWQIVQCHRTKPAVYTIADENGKTLKQRFYAEQLLKVGKNEETTYRVEKVLKTRTRNGEKEFLIKWVGFPNEYNSYVKESDFVT